MTTIAPQRNLMTVPEAAERLRVSAKTIYRLAANRALPVLYVGAQIRIDEAELEAWLLEASGRGESDG